MATIYFDMDGVLADFDRGLRELCHFEPKSVNAPRDDAYEDAMWAAIRAVPHFYGRLEPMPGAVALFNQLRGMARCEILTGIPKPKRGITTAAEDKTDWVRRYLGAEVRVNVVLREDKPLYCRGRDCILIDDTRRNIEAWEAMGGTGLLYADAETALREVAGRVAQWAEASDMRIRRFTEADARAVSDLIVRTMRISNAADYPPEMLEALTARMQPRDILDRAAWTHFYVAEEGDEIIGCGAIGPYWGAEDQSSLFTIFVKPECQGKGVGKAVVEALEADEFALRARRIEVPASVTALEFYRRLGYDYKDGDATMDAEERLYRLEKHRASIEGREGR